jgi:PAS domain S-box-containing protein
MKTDNRTSRLSSGALSLAAVIVTTLLAVAVSVYSVSHGRFTVFQNLFYFPIIIACIYYLKRGFVFSVGLAFFYFVLIAAHTADFILIREALIRVALFILVAGVVTFIALRRRQTEEKLKTSNDFTEGILNSISDPLFVMDPANFTIIEANDAFRNDYGQEVIGKRCYELTHQKSTPCTPPDDPCPLVATLKTGKPSCAEHIHYSGDGIKRFSEISVSPIRNKRGKIQQIVHIDRDVTEHKKAQEALRESEEKYRNLVEKSSDWVWAVDQEGRYTYSSPKVWDILGYQPEELIGKTPFDLMPPEEVSKVAGIFSGYIAARKPFSGLVNINLHKDGRRMSLETSAEPIFDVAGAFTGYRGIDRDITERKQAEEVLRASEERYRIIMETVNLGISLIDINHKIIMTNKFFAELFKKPAADFVGKYCFMEFEKRKAICPHCPAVLSMASGKPAQVETEGVRDNGSRFNVLLRTAPTFASDGTVNGFVEVVEDITESKQARERLSKEMALKSFLIDLYKKAPALADVELYDYVLEHVVGFTDSTIGFFHLVSDNQKNIVMTAWSTEALKNCTASSATHYPIDQAGNWVDCVRLKQAVIYNDFPRSPNQKGLPAGHSPLRRFMSVPVVEGDKVRFIFGAGNKTEEYTADDAVLTQLVANDLQRIIVQRRTEEALSRSEMYFRALIENSADIITILDTDGTIRYESPSVKRTLGYEPSELIGRNVFEFVHPDDLPAVSDVFGNVIQKPGDIISTELRFRYNDGSWRVLESVGQNMLENEVVKGIVFNSRDITEYNDDSWRILESVGQNMLENGAVKGIVMNSRDITERKKIQAELQKKNLELAQAYEELSRKQAMIIEKEKMASIGMLAAGIAHEIKNPLAIILQGIEYLQTAITDNSPMVEVVARLNRAILRADKIVKGLIGYSRQDQLSLSAQDIPALIDESLVLMENELRKKNLQVIKQYAPDLPEVAVDGNQIKQAFINVLLNGIEAMPRNGAFTLAVRKIQDGKDGNILQISFKDTGPGIPADRIHKIFDPFYTSKGVSNTGLGLYISRGIIDKHKGVIHAESENEQGANIIIELPIQ